MIRRYEQVDGTVTKFWEIERRDDVSFTCRWGKAGAAGRNERNYGHPDAATSKQAADKLIAEKQKTGFSLIGGKKKPAKPVVKKAIAKSSATANLAKLEAMLADNPEDAGTWQVYADALLEQGVAWGEVVALAASGTRPKQQQAAAAKELLRDLDGSTLEWRFGTLDKVTLCPEEDDSGDDGGEAELTNYAATLKRILKHPAGRLVRELELGLPPSDDIDWSYDAILPTLTGSGTLPLLRVLDLTADAEFMDQDSWRAIGDLSKLWAIAPQLRELRLKGSSNDEGTSTKLGTIVAPHLEKLVHISSGLSKNVPVEIGKATFPELRHLELYLGEEDYGNTCKVKSFAGIFDGKGLPRLEYLGLSNSEWERELIVALAKAPIVRRLRTLDLTKGTLWREGAQALIEHAAAFRHLELLDVRDNYFDDEQAAAIKKAIPCANVSEQKELDGDGDDDDPFRYVTVGE